MAVVTRSVSRAASHVFLILDLRILFAGSCQRGADLLHVQLFGES